MDEKMKELIAIGVSVGVHCQPCVDFHVKAARSLGIDDASIRAAMEVGTTVEKGAMSAMKDFLEKQFASCQPGPGSCCAPGGGMSSCCR